MKTEKDVKKIKVRLYFVQSGGGGGETLKQRKRSDKQIKT